MLPTSRNFIVLENKQDNCYVHILDGSTSNCSAIFGPHCKVLRKALDVAIDSETYVAFGPISVHIPGLCVPFDMDPTVRTYDIRSPLLCSHLHCQLCQSVTP